MPKIGGHVSAAISLDLCFERAEKIGADCFQFFVSPPQRWDQSKHSPEVIARFKERAVETGIGPNFIHGTYLINLGSADPAHLQKSIDWLIYAQNMASQLGVVGTIFHLGSHKGSGFQTIVDQVIKSIKEVLASSPSDSLLLLENSAGGGGAIGGTFSELGQILAGVADPRAKICFDTQHAFAAGYDTRTPLGIRDLVAELEEQIGFDNLAAIHANDSKTEFHSHRDRHENIGEGFLTEEAFKLLMKTEPFNKVPWLLEVPGDNKSGPDKLNVDRLKSYL